MASPDLKRYVPVSPELGGNITSRLWTLVNRVGNGIYTKANPLDPKAAFRKIGLLEEACANLAVNPVVIDAQNTENTMVFCITNKSNMGENGVLGQDAQIVTIESTIGEDDQASMTVSLARLSQGELVPVADAEEVSLREIYFGKYSFQMTGGQKKDTGEIKSFHLANLAEALRMLREDINSTFQANLIIKTVSNGEERRIEDVLDSKEEILRGEKFLKEYRIRRGL